MCNKKEQEQDNVDRSLASKHYIIYIHGSQEKKAMAHGGASPFVSVIFAYRSC